MARNAFPLRKIRTHATTVKLGIFTYTSDTAWATGDGYVVHRVTFQGNTEYKLLDKNGRPSTLANLDEVRESIDWLRERGR